MNKNNWQEQNKHKIYRSHFVCIINAIYVYGGDEASNKKKLFRRRRCERAQKTTLRTRCTRSLSVYVRMSGIAHGLHALFVFDMNGFSMLNALLLTSFFFIYRHENHYYTVASVYCILFMFSRHLVPYNCYCAGKCFEFMQSVARYLVCY